MLTDTGMKELKREKEQLLTEIHQTKKDIEDGQLNAKEHLEILEREYHQNFLKRKALGGDYVKRAERAETIRGNRDKYGVLKNNDSFFKSFKETESFINKRRASTSSFWDELKRRRKRRKISR